MPTNDERREVADKLRDMAPGSDWPNYVAEACGMDVSKMSNNFHTFTEQLCQRIADLIEPEERTCRCGVKTIGQVYPDGFDFDGEYTTIYIFPLSCGHEVRSLTNRIPRFCPSCGRKVVDE